MAISSFLVRFHFGRYPYPTSFRRLCHSIYKMEMSTKVRNDIWVKWIDVPRMSNDVLIWPFLSFCHIVNGRRAAFSIPNSFRFFASMPTASQLPPIRMKSTQMFHFSHTVDQIDICIPVLCMSLTSSLPSKCFIIIIYATNRYGHFWQTHTDRAHVLTVLVCDFL